MSRLAPGGDATLALTTASSSEEAERIGVALVEQELAACCNVVGPIRSIYRWKGAVLREPEFLVLIKTRRELLERLAIRLRELHTYDCPELITFPVETGLADYLGWLSSSTGSSR